MNILNSLIRTLVFGLSVVAGLTSESALGATYYVNSSSGNDGNSGTSSGTAWKTLSKVNGVVSYNAGDSILFVRGGQWNGQLAPQGSGASGTPIVIDAYGSSSLPMPQLNGQGVVSATVFLENQEYWEIRNLEITNTGSTLGSRNGIYIGAEHYGQVNHIYLVDLVVHDVNGDDTTWHGTTGGVFFHITGEVTDPGATPTWYNDILIDGCFIYNCSQRGITGPYSPWSTRTLTGNTNWTPSTNVTISNCLFEHCRRQGLVWRVADGVVIEHNIFANCSDGSHGNAMFVFNTDNALIQMNEAYGTRFETGNPEPGQDAAGFDIDFRTKGTVLQYNYAHDNGEGGIIATGGPTTTSGAESFCDGSIIRYNILQNNHRAALRFSGRMTETHVYNNTIYIGEHLPDAVDRIIEIGDWSGQWPDSTKFYNNVIANYSYGAAYDIGVGATNTVFDYNTFYDANDPATDEPSGSHQNSADPKFVAGGTGGYGWDTVDGYQLKSGSPSLLSGKIISTNGGRDYYNNSVSPSSAPNRGAYGGAALTAAAAPTFSSPGGVFSTSQSVSISSATSGASIFYTLDGSTPSPVQGTLYSSSISIGESTLLKAVAVKSGYAASAVTFTSFHIPTGTTKVLEAESLSVTTSGATAANLSDSKASGGACKTMTATYTFGDGILDVTNQWVEFTTPSIAAGTYALSMRYKQASSRVKVEVMLDGFQIGDTVDEYASSSGYAVAQIGTIKFTAASIHRVRLVINGQNASSSGFVVTADQFVLHRLPIMDLEAENMSRIVSGASATTGPDDNASGYRWVSFSADGLNDYIEFTTPNILAGDYDLNIRYKAYTNRGIAAVKVDGSTVGSIDQYGASVAWPTKRIATVSLVSSGTHTVRLTVSGKNGSSSDYKLMPDLISFTPSSVALEAEDMTRSSSGATTSVLTGDPSASGGSLVVLNSDGVSDYVEFTTSSIAAGAYDLSLSYKGYASRGIAQIMIDGVEVGAPVDMYSSSSSYPTVEVGPVALLTSGAHTIRLTVTGKNGSSSDYLITADQILLTPQ